MSHKIIRTANIEGTYGTEQAVVSVQTTGRWKGRYFTRGAGYAGRVAYQTQERAERSIEAHRCFRGWAA
ncbi:hypothetical protein L7H23_01085 [Sphingopyxis sp. BSN-002]|uniref:hypothetical protein n=1 Tax=Sphingopyxis sp. BSN-002 TaxID=2911495 RepID=UPI001EDBC2B6|nr:hypothetical protein [Sphingopyxis sp. BSN-002]QVJ07668.1 hypothetical protein [Sphingopyxis phage VSN-002]UKK84727.1 hypothetical protein L7H23_01085 [Sphingopyxis sp. BSN-002]